MYSSDRRKRLSRNRLPWSWRIPKGITNDKARWIWNDRGRNKMAFDLEFKDIINGVSIVAAAKGILEITRSDEYGYKGAFKKIGYKTNSLRRGIFVTMA